MASLDALSASFALSLPATGRPSISMQTLLFSFLSASTLVSAQSPCISLQNSTACPAFQSASIITSGPVTQSFPFLQFVSDRASFDEQLQSYVQTAYVRNQYETRFGCDNIDLTNTSELYARFTTTVMCSAIVQSSIDACNLSEEDSRPVCADTCALFAQSEALLTADGSICANPNDNLVPGIRADFTQCYSPPGSLSLSSCVQGISNEPENCGYGNSTLGLCSYCGAGGINSTDTCCYNSNVDERCADVTLPSVIPSMTFEPPTATSSIPSSTSAPGGDGDDNNDDGGLSGGAIAGIVVGAIAGVLLLAALIFFCLRRRKRASNRNEAVLNHPSPSRGDVPAEKPARFANQGYDVIPGGRIARMSALEASSDPSRGHAGVGAAAAAGAGVGYMAGRGRSDQSSSDFDSSPESESRAGMGVLRPPPTNIRRHGSLSSGSVLAGEDPSSPTSGGGMSSPQGMTSQQSEQLPFFKDYYSSDDIHPGDRVSVLWAYQPRAADEFSLERGDMLKIVGIWDDGWATGILVDERADEWDVRRSQRDSGVSNSSGREVEVSPPVTGEIKAFPLVCVCLPEHWRKTIEGDSSTDS